MAAGGVFITGARITTYADDVHLQRLETAADAITGLDVFALNAMRALHERYLRCGIRDRDDTGHMKSIDPTYESLSPRW